MWARGLAESYLLDFVARGRNQLAVGRSPGKPPLRVVFSRLSGSGFQNAGKNAE